MAKKSGFTLVELLTVIAITAVLMTVIIIPVIQSFNLMRAGQAFSDAQDKAAKLVEQIGREISQVAAVRDNSGVKGSVAVFVPNPAGTPVRVLLPYSKIDLVKPAEGDPTRGPTGALINPLTGKEDPTLRAPKGQMVLPAAQGGTIVRYFIALRDPYADYNEPYTGLLMLRNGGRDNLYVLYRAEVQPWVWSPGLGRFVVNKALFFDLDRDADPTTSGPWFDDPDFMNRNVALPGYSIADPNPGAPADPTKDQMIRNWLSRATVVTEVSRYDMVQPVFDRRTRVVETYTDPADNLVKPRIYSLIQFRPSTVSNEPAEAMTAQSLGNEAEGMEDFGADVFRTKMGGWSNLLVRFWPQGWGAGQPYEVGRSDPNGVAPGLSVYYYDPAGGGTDATAGTELFDIDEYTRSVRFGQPYPFTRAMLAANARSAWSTNPTLRAAFTPFYAEAGTGKVIASFPITEWGSAPVPLSAGTPFDGENVAHMNTGPALTPTNDGAVGGNFFDAPYSPSNGGGTDFTNPLSGSSINKLFNKVWADHPEMRPNVHRFIDLRVVTHRDGSPSPLNPDPLTGLARAKIVPNSEVVIGPDQNPGPNYGRMIRYTRTNAAPGPNQYRINYTDLREPADYALIGFPNPPAAYTPNDFTSAIIQPRYKAGYVQLNSDPNVPLPADDTSSLGATPTVNEGNISISYRFQFTRAGDTVAVDYDTSQLVQVLLTVKNYAQTTLPNSQSVTLKATATVRNVLR